MRIRAADPAYSRNGPENTCQAVENLEVSPVSDLDRVDPASHRRYQPRRTEEMERRKGMRNKYEGILFMQSIQSIIRAPVFRNSFLQEQPYDLSRSIPGDLLPDDNEIRIRFMQHAGTFYRVVVGYRDLIQSLCFGSGIHFLR